MTLEQLAKESLAIRIPRTEPTVDRISEWLATLKLDLED